MNNPVLILHLEDDPRDVELVRDKLRQTAMSSDLRVAHNRVEYETALAQTRFDLILSDYTLPGYGGLAAMALAQQKQPGVPFIMTSGMLGEAQAVECVLRGATDYVLKQNLDRLVPAVMRALTEAEEHQKRREAEKALRESEEMLRLLMDSTAEAIYGLDMDGKFTFCNAACLRLLGYAHPRDLLGKRMHVLIHHSRADGTPLPEDDSTVRRSSRQGKGAHASDQVYWRADGTCFPVEYWSYPMWRGGELIGVVVTFFDITERKRAEESQVRLATAVEQATDAMAITDANATILYVNPAFEKITGYTRKEVVGQNLRVLKSGKHDAEFYRRMWAILTRGEVWRGRFTNKRKDGTLYEEEKTISPVRGAKGEIVNYVAVGRDGTERMRAEEEIRALNANLERRVEERTAEVQAANRAKSAFLANMSHEIRTPMNAILGYAQLLRRDSSLSAEAAEKLNIINRSGEHLLSLINDVLEMSKIEAGRVTLEPTTFDLSAMLADLASMFRLRTEAKGLAFETAILGEVPRHIVADEGKVRQVLVNLLSNAVKFTDRGGIVLRASAKKDSASQLRLVAEVEDTGHGIAAEEQDRLFQLFEQTASGRKAQAGTGLGLAISRQYARLMGGDITATSELNKGSVFRVEIPIQQSDSGCAVKQGEQRQVIGLKPGQPPVRVLVVDDNKTNRGLLKDLLTLVGFQVREADDGEEAVRAWEDWKPPLILMDVVMPVMDGYEATREIRALRDGKTTRILAVTASVLERSRQAIRDAGMDDFISKPIHESELFEKIRQHLRVDYLYAEDKPSPAVATEISAASSASLAKLPAELLAQMRAAIENGEMDQLRQLIWQVVEYDEPLAKTLHSLADHYEYDALSKLLTKENTQ